MNTKLILCAIALTTAPLAVFAEETAPPAAAAPKGEHHGHMNPEERVKAMTDTLGLNADQSSKILAILQGDADKLKALHGETTLSQDDRKAKAKEIMTASHEAISQILTADQQAKWKAEMEKRHAEHQNGGQPK